MASKRGRRVRRSGVLPGHYQRQGVVTIRTQSLTQKGDPRTWEVKDNYIVETVLLDKQWRFQVEFKGQVWDIPGQVVERMMAQRESIIKEHRRTLALDRVKKVLEEQRPPGL